MKKNYLFKKATLYSVLLFSLILSGCSDGNILQSSASDNIETSQKVTTRGTCGDSFDWEDSTIVSMVDGTGNVVKRNLPWQDGSFSIGIPSDWIDHNIDHEDYSHRMYTKKNYWELVYSNVKQESYNKYIILYNKLTGILRCFFYVLGTPGEDSPANSVWGIGIDNANSILNFNSDIVEDENTRPSNCIYMSTLTGLFSNNKFSSNSPYKNEVWYGYQVECAYDSQTSVSNKYDLYVEGRALKEITYTGTSTSTGDITGTITNSASAGSSGGLNISVSDMFNTSATCSVDKTSIASAVGSQIQKGVDSNNSFYTSLWNNIKSNASKWISSGLESGVEKGISAIVSQGGSVVAGALGSLFSSVIGGGNSNVSTVDLKMKLNTNYTFTSTEITGGWGDLNNLPAPGTLTNEDASGRLIYNNVLGVWNLKRTPQITLKYDAVNLRDPNKVISYGSVQEVAAYSCNENSSILAINPIVTSDFTVTNFSCRVVRKDSKVITSVDCVPLLYINYEPVLINANSYYCGSTLYDPPQRPHDIYESINSGTKNGIVEVKFNLVNKSDNSIVYYYKKYFKADVVVSE